MEDPNIKTVGDFKDTLLCIVTITEGKDGTPKVEFREVETDEKK
jgi:hypothetical protein